MAFDSEAYSKSAQEARRAAWAEVAAAQERTAAWQAQQDTAPWYKRAYDTAADYAGSVITAGSEFLSAYGDVVRDRLDAVERANETGDYTGTYAFDEQSQEAAGKMNEAGGQLVSAVTAPVRNNMCYLLGSTIGETVNAYANEGSELAQGIRDNATFVGYLMTDEAKLRKAREIEEETGISAETILSDDVAYKQALKIDDFTRKQKALMQDGFSMEAVWKEYPEIKDIANMNPQDVALALHHIEAVRSTHGIVNTFTHFLATGNKKLELDNLNYKIAIGAANENDKQRAEDLREQIAAEEKEAPSFFDDPAAAIAAGLAQSAPEMVQSVREGVQEGLAVATTTGLIGAQTGSAIAPGAGTAAGGAIGSIGGFLVGVGRSMSARAARRELIKRAVQIGMYNGMARPEIGARFDEYRNMKDENGSRLFTDDQARGYAFAAGSANAAIEMANFGVVTKSLKGTPHAAQVFKDIIGRAGARMSARESLSKLVRERAGEALKVTATEAGEEGLQSISDDLIHDIAVTRAGRYDLGHSTKEVAQNAFVSMAEALPGAMGFGIVGAGGGTVVGGTRLGRALQRQAKAETAYGERARQTMTGTIMLEQLQQAAGSSSLQNVAPDVQRKVLRNQLAGTGYETAYIDVEMAKEKEGGLDDLKTVGAAAGYTPEQIETAIETNGHLMIPVEQFAQAKTSSDLLDAVSFSPEADSMARMRRDTQAVMQQIKERNIAAAERQEKLTDKILDEYLPVHEDGSVDSDGRELMRAAIYTNPENPSLGWRELYKEMRDDLYADIAPVMERLKSGMGKGGQILAVKDDVGNDTYIRYTENDPWYQDFYKEHKRQPTVAELEDMAVAVVTGDASAPKLEGWIPDSAETAEEMAAAAPGIQSVRNMLTVMERIKTHMKEMTSAEMRLTEGLSPEAFHVYRDLSKKLTAIGGQTAPVARLNAILFARHADIFASAVSKKTSEKLTAKDYYERFFGLDSEGKYKADLHQAAERRAEENLRTDEKLWKDELKKVFRNELEGDSFVTIMRTPLALQLVGAKDLPVKIKVSKLRRILKDHPNMSKDTLRQLPRAMTDPMIIFKSQTVQGRLVVALTLKDNDGVNVVVPMELDSTDGALDANIVTSAYGKDDRDGDVRHTWYWDNINAKNTLYANKKEVAEVFKAVGVQFPITREAVSNLFGSSIKTDEDLVKLKTQHETLYQIAWHGSPYWFEHFDLGMIGMGEGHQAHGWGLYFAKDRHISEAYKTWLEHMPKVHTKTDTYTLDEEGRWILEKRGTRFEDGSPVDQALMAFEGAEGDLAAAKEDVKKQLAFFQDRKMEKSVAIMREALNILEKEGGEWTLEHDRPTLYQVEIPDEEYMFYENMTVAAQNDYVKPRVEKVIANLTEEQRSRFVDGAMRGISSAPSSREYNKALSDLLAVKAPIEGLRGLDAVLAISRNNAERKLREAGYSDEQIAAFKADKAFAEKTAKEVEKERSERIAELEAFIKKERDERDAEIAAMKEKYRTGAWVRDEKLGRMNGVAFYQALSRALDGDRKASLALNNAGIPGIVYDGGRDDHCFVVFDDKAVKIIETYNQAAQRVNQGYITRFDNGQRIVTLLKNADASTFLHEMGHLFLFDLEYLAQFDETSARELAVVREWAEWHEGAAREYARTKWADEFADREKAIRAALKKGDTAAVEKLKKEWRQERFARAFELYLYDGKAPAKGLRAVFRKFKKFLIQIYGLVTNDRVRASLAVQRVMDRMIATEEEIDAAALDDVYRDIETVGGEKLFTESEEATHKRLQEEALEEAKSVLRARAMKDLTKQKEKAFRAQLEEERRRKEEELQDYPVYVAEAAIKKSGKKDIVSFFGFKDFEEYHEVRESVGDLKTHLDAHMAKYEKELDKQLTEQYLTDGAADALLMGSKYQAQRAALVEQALKKKLYALRRVDTKTQKLMRTVEEKINELPEKINLKEKTPAQAELEKAIDVMKVTEKWKPDELRALQALADAATKEAFWNGFKKFQKLAARKARRDRTRQKQEEAAEYVVRNLGEGAADVYRDIAREMIARMNIADACNIDKHTRRVRESKKRVDKMIKAKKIDAAMLAQREVAVGYALIHEAQEVKAQVDQLRERVHKQLAARSVHLPKEERYWHRHLAYVLRLSKQDVKRPEGMEEVNLYQTLKRITGDLDANLDYDSVLAMEIAGQGGNFKGYGTLTLEEFKEMVDVLTMLYITGRDRFKMKTVAGKDIAEIVDEIITDKSDAQQMKRMQMVIGDDRGGMGYNDLVAKVSEKAALQGQKALAAITKPEEVLRALGENAHRYIYGTYERAAEKEGAMLAEAHEALGKILAPYDRTELMGWKKKSIRITPIVGGEIAVTKENIITMALNMGNETNLRRLAGGLRMTFGENAKDEERTRISETYVKSLVEAHMTARDWQLVQDVWDYINTFWKETVEVEEKLNGVTLEKVKARPFTVRTADGEELNMRGGYYPISFDPDKSAKAQEQDVNAEAKKGMSGAQVFGTHRGHTKARSEGDISRPLRLDMDVLTEHVDNVIHNIAYRIAARDVYRLINNEAFYNHVKGTLGTAYYNILKEWSTDVWATATVGDNKAQSLMDGVFGTLRRGAVMGIMGYRMFPVLENASNIAVCMDKIGTTETLGAIGEFYTNFDAHVDLMHKSVFMSNRINDMERDIKQDPRLFHRTYLPAEWLRDHAYTMMKYSDLMLSAPTWVRSYKNAYPEKLEEVRCENEENIKAFADAQARRNEIKARLHDLRTGRVSYAQTAADMAAEAAQNDIDSARQEEDNKAREVLEKRLDDARIWERINDDMELEDVRERFIVQEKVQLNRLANACDRLYKTGADEVRLQSMKNVLADGMRHINAMRREFYDGEFLRRMGESAGGRDKIREGSRLARSLQDARSRVDQRGNDGVLGGTREARIIPGEHDFKHPLLIELQKELAEERHSQEDALSRGKNTTEQFRQEGAYPADDMQDMGIDNKEVLERLQKELWAAELALDKAAELPNLTDAEILKEAERRAVFAADGVIRDTFGSGRVMDLPSISRQKNEAYKMMTTFYSFFNTQFNAVLAAHRHAKFGGEKGFMRRMPLFRALMFRLVFASLIGAVIKFALGLEGDDDKDKYRKVKDPKTGKIVRVEVSAYERFLKVYAKNTLGMATGALVGVRDVAKLAMDWMIDGSTYGRGLNPFAIAFKGMGELGTMVMMIAEKSERDLAIEERAEKREEAKREKLRKLHGKARQEYLKKLAEEEKYRAPEKRITYSEILRHGLNAVSTFTAHKTGVTNTVADAVTGMMMYGFDDVGRYDMGEYWMNFWRTVFFDKKPRERSVPEKPEKPKKNKRNERRNR